MKPCPECPFSRKVTPGALGGSPPEKYIGQSIGPYKLPCHKHYVNDPEWRREDTITTPDCIGAAIFRANIGVGHLLPEVLLRMPPDKEAVFANHAEFLAHHKGIDVVAARLQLMAKPAVLLLEEQLKASGNMVWIVERK